MVCVAFSFPFSKNRPLQIRIHTKAGTWATAVEILSISVTVCAHRCRTVFVLISLKGLTNSDTVVYHRINNRDNELKGGFDFEVTNII